ncbi:hypothetical protein [Sinorhizobium psoraleae]|uniref:Uncharacterized protein n=1 Tax=Sinorhizobium psoraleae TaxID=520838 RepID=A0ABT4K9G3_9HYPH|nr:hypothetical protein [Sinorhizobium psoraleae]MCZ4088608.1 hypothetical protein [Sinorhizobium psoraleae]
MKDATAQREKVILASVMAANANPGWLTSDRVEALTGGHGMLNIPVVAVCNVIATELRRGVSPEVKFADAVHQPIDDLLAKTVAVAKAGAPTAPTPRSLQQPCSISAAQMPRSASPPATANSALRRA